MAENKDHARSLIEIATQRQHRTRNVRRALAGTAAAVALSFVVSQTPLVRPVESQINDPDRPDATEAYIGGKVIIIIASDPKTGEIFPKLRRNPSLHNPKKDGFNSNVISWDNIEKINDTQVELKPGSKIDILNYTTTLGENADNAAPGAPKTPWGVLEITQKNGTKENAYYSISQQTSDLIKTDDKGLLTPINQKDGVISDKLNSVTVINP